MLWAVWIAGWDGWDVALLAAAVYIAVVSLVRLMQARRTQIVAQLRGDLQRSVRKKQRGR